jgi:hypothetical protein
MTMSDSLPKPLPSINALRAHLKLLERGVNDARDKRVGPRPLTPMPMQRAASPAARPQAQSTNSFQLPAARSTEGSNGKPKAKPKTGADFSAFFSESEAKRAAS